MTPAPVAINFGRETVAQRIALLQAQARMLAEEQTNALLAALAQVERLANEIAEGGESYPVGIREIARRLSEDAPNRSLTIQAISRRGQ